MTKHEELALPDDKEEPVVKPFHSDKIDFSVSTGRKSEHQTGEAILHVKATTVNGTFSVDIPLHRVADA